MKIVKMLSPHTDHFDGFIRSRLNEAEVNEQLADKYINDMQFPVPVEPAAPGGWKLFFNKYKGKFLFWTAIIVFTGAAAWYFVQRDHHHPVQSNTAPGGGATGQPAFNSTAGADNSNSSENNSATNQTGAPPETANTVPGNSTGQSGHSGVQRNGGWPPAGSTESNASPHPADYSKTKDAASPINQPNDTATFSGNSPRRAAGEVPAGSLGVNNIAKQPAAIDSAAKKINALKPAVKKDTVNIIW